VPLRAPRLEAATPRGRLTRRSDRASTATQRPEPFTSTWLMRAQAQTGPPAVVVRKNGDYDKGRRRPCCARHDAAAECRARSGPTARRVRVNSGRCASSSGSASSDSSAPASSASDLKCRPASVRDAGHERDCSGGQVESAVVVDRGWATLRSLERARRLRGRWSPPSCAVASAERGTTRRRPGGLETSPGPGQLGRAELDALPRKNGSTPAHRGYRL
jgi:hypothetical protein